MKFEMPWFASIITFSVVLSKIIALVGSFKLERQGIPLTVLQLAEPSILYFFHTFHHKVTRHITNYTTATILCPTTKTINTNTYH